MKKLVTIESCRYDETFKDYPPWLIENVAVDPCWPHHYTVILCTKKQADYLGVLLSDQEIEQLVRGRGVLVNMKDEEGLRLCLDAMVADIRIRWV